MRLRRARPSVWFVVPADGRVELARVCLRQLARTCGLLERRGVDASAVVVADDENLETARRLGFATVERGNGALGAKWNDGYELAGRTGVDFVVPFGSDDWVDAELIAAALPDQDSISCFRLSAVVREDGQRLARLRIPYDGGDGVRIIPAGLLAPLGFRPAVESRRRAIDTSVLAEITRAHGRPPRLDYRDRHGLQIVDFKSPAGQLNGYAGCLEFSDGPEEPDPWRLLAGVYPADAIAEAAAVMEQGG